VSTLVATATFEVWGYGCEWKPFIRMSCEPLTGGAFVTLDARGRGGDQHVELLLDVSELAAFIGALIGPLPPGDPPVFTWGSSANGLIAMKLPLSTGLVEMNVDEGDPRRLVAMADRILALLERGGLTLDPRFHPLPQR
jgi:hypothetical protein